MINIIDLKLSKNNQIITKYHDLRAIITNDNLTFQIENTKMSINKKTLIRENKDYKIKLNFQEGKGTILLKGKNMLFDIDIIEWLYKQYSNKIILEYLISTDEEKFGIEINIKGDKK